MSRLLNRPFVFFATLLCATAALAVEAPAPTPLITKSASELVAVLKSGASLKEKADACRELAVVGDSSAVPELARLLADDELNHMALYALKTMSGSSVDKALRSELTRLDGRRLIGVVGCLGFRRDYRAVKPLKKLLASSDAKVAQAAARALGRIGSADAAKAILARLPTAPSANRRAFCEGCLRCAETLAAGGQARQAMAIYEQLRASTNMPAPARIAALRGALLTCGAQDLTFFRESLASDDYTVFITAVQASREMPGREVTSLLVESLARVSADERMVLVQALGERGEREALPGLCSLVKHDPTARLAALRAIAAIGGPVAVNTMVENIASPVPEISRAARDGLAGIPGPEADVPVIAMLADKNAGPRLIGIELAERRSLTAQVPTLIKACDDADHQVQLAALQGVGELGSVDEVPALIAWVLDATDETDCDAGAEALKSLIQRCGKPDSATAQIVCSMAQARALQKEAFLGVLCSVGGSQALSAVRGALANPDADVRDAAIHALAGWSDPAAAADLLKLLLSTKAIPERELAFRGYVRLANDTSAATEKFKMLSQAATMAASSQDQKLVLSGLANVISVDSLRLVASRLSDPTLVDEASAAAVKIAAKLGAKYGPDISAVLNRVLKTEKSQRLLDQARNCLAQLGGLGKLN